MAEPAREIGYEPHHVASIDSKERLLSLFRGEDAAVPTPEPEFDGVSRAEEMLQQLSAFDTEQDVESDPEDSNESKDAKEPKGTGLPSASHDAKTEAAFDEALALHRSGDLSGAERAYRLADERGHTTASFNLGVLLADQGRNQTAMAFFEKAAAAGHVGGMNNLGSLHEEFGNHRKSEEWFERAAEGGHSGAMNNLGSRRRGDGQLAAAALWFRRAADVGCTDGMNNLAAINHIQGHFGEAEWWYREAVSDGHLGALHNLTGLLANRGGDSEREAQELLVEALGGSQRCDELLLLAGAGERNEDRVSTLRRILGEWLTGRDGSLMVWSTASA